MSATFITRDGTFTNAEQELHLTAEGFAAFQQVPDDLKAAVLECAQFLVAAQKAGLFEGTAKPIDAHNIAEMVKLVQFMRQCEADREGSAMTRASGTDIAELLRRLGDSDFVRV